MHPYFYAFLFLVLGQCADYITSRAALQRGAYEMNWLIRKYGLSTVKLVDTLLLTLTLLWLPARLVRWVGLAYGLFFGGAAVWNLKIMEHTPMKGKP